MGGMSAEEETVFESDTGTVKLNIRALSRHFPTVLFTSSYISYGHLLFFHPHWI